MKRNDILQHFPNGCTVECLTKKIKAPFDANKLNKKDVPFIVGEKVDYIECWGFHDYHTDAFIVVEKNGQLATIIEPENNIVFAQLGKEVKAILDKESNYAVIGEKVSRLYER